MPAGNRPGVLLYTACRELQFLAASPAVKPPAPMPPKDVEAGEHKTSIAVSCLSPGDRPYSENESGSEMRRGLSTDGSCSGNPWRRRKNDRSHRSRWYALAWHERSLLGRH